MLWRAASATSRTVPLRSGALPAAGCAFAQEMTVRTVSAPAVERVPDRAHMTPWKLRGALRLAGAAVGAVARRLVATAMAIKARVMPGMEPGSLGIDASKPLACAAHGEQADQPEAAQAS